MLVLRLQDSLTELMHNTEKYELGAILTSTSTLLFRHFLNEPLERTGCHSSQDASVVETWQMHPDLLISRRKRSCCQTSIFVAGSGASLADDREAKFAPVS